MGDYNKTIDNYSFIHFIHSFIHSFIHFIHSFIHFIHFIHSSLNTTAPEYGSFVVA